MFLLLANEKGITVNDPLWSRLSGVLLEGKTFIEPNNGTVSYNISFNPLNNVFMALPHLTVKNREV